MAEMVGLSRDLRRRSGAVSGLVAALKRALSRLTGGSRSNRMRPEEWPDYLLRDIGLDRTVGDDLDPRAAPRDWLRR